MFKLKKRLNIILSALLVMSIAVIAGFYVHSRRSIGLTIPVPTMSKQTVMALAHVHQTATKDGRVQWELRAVSASFDEAGARMVLKSPEVDFFLEDGGTVHMTADRGILFTETNNIEAHGHVRLVHDRYIMTAESLVYQHRNRILKSDQPVEITGDIFDLKAEGLIYDLNANRADFSGRVKGEIRENVQL